jgi:Leucine-rich repeat (LRR) protein
VVFDIQAKEATGKACWNRRTKTMANVKWAIGKRLLSLIIFSAILSCPAHRRARSAGVRPEGLRTAPRTAEVRTGERIVKFPQGRSLGELYVQDAATERRIETFHHWIDGTSWEYLGEARGDVPVPPRMRLWLSVGKDAWKDLSPLSQLRPDDLYRLSFSYVSPEQKMSAPDDRCVRHLLNLTQLKVLDLNNTKITAEGLRLIRNLRSLESFTIPAGSTDAGMAHVSNLRSLRALHFSENKVTSAGLAYLANLSSLEELDLGGERIGDEGLVHVGKLPSLRYLFLWGKGFSDAGLAHLRNCRSLRILNLMHLPITNTGLAHLSAFPGLERLDLYDTRVSDAGLVHLKRIRSLKMLGLGGIPKGQITDKGLAYLSEIKSLEYLDLPDETVTDEGLAYLSELKMLRHLSVFIPHHVNAKDYTKYYTEKGLAELVKLLLLEELFLGGPGVTDAAMSHISQLAKLQKLSLFGCPITDKGLAELTKLKSLQELWLFASNVTLSDLAKLNAIPSLTYLRVQQIERGAGILNIGNLTKLEKLTINLNRNLSFRDEDLACLAKFTRLKWLQGVWGISDVGMAHLAGLTSMERLSVGGPGLTDKGMAYLANMKNLDNLSVTGDFTDEGLRCLETLTGLRSLNITSEGAFTNAALNRLRRRLPNLQTLNVIP